jgi:aconitase B
MLEAYRAHVAERAALGIPPAATDAKQTSELIELLIKAHRPAKSIPGRTDHPPRAGWRR